MRSRPALLAPCKHPVTSEPEYLSIFCSHTWSHRYSCTWLYSTYPLLGPDTEPSSSSCFSPPGSPHKGRLPVLLPVSTESKMGNMVPSWSGPSYASAASPYRRSLSPAAPSPRGSPPAACATPRRPRPQARRRLEGEFSAGMLTDSSGASSGAESESGDLTMAWATPSGSGSGSGCCPCSPWTSPSSPSGTLSPIEDRTPLTGPYGRDAYLYHSPGLYSSTPLH